MGWLIGVLALFLVHGRPLAAQTAPLPTGFQRLSGQYVEIITDLPLSEEIQQLPKVFDAAIPTWCRVFDMTLAEVADWRGTVYVMLDRGRFQSAGLIPDHLPNFPFGFQFGNQMWLTEQPSAYYRRHLMLHEGTHWFMNRKYGENGPPWLMEGMAEWLGTHRWNAANQQLVMGVIPSNKREVPYWGRLSLIQDQLASGIAPSLETIMRYDNTAHQHVDAYAWSWAVVLFLQSHPNTKASFQALLKRPMHADSRLTRWLFGRLRDDWPYLRQEWNAMLSDLDYGYDLSRGFARITRDAAAKHAEPFEIDTSQSWQASGICVRTGEKIKITAGGQFVVGRVPDDWVCYPDGVTLQYHRGQPLGRLMMAVLAPIRGEPPFSSFVSSTAVGAELVWTATNDGELHFRVNEAGSGLSDNEGKVRIAIEPAP